jgi:hypothetical protein
MSRTLKLPRMSMPQVGMRERSPDSVQSDMLEVLNDLHFTSKRCVLNNYKISNVELIMDAKKLRAWETSQ